MESKAPGMESGEKAVAIPDNQSNSSDLAPGVMVTGDTAIENAPIDMSELKEMNKGLQSRHLQMMALAGAIGTGLFLGSGRAVAQAGPVGAFLGYTLIGFSAAGVVLAVAEMAALVPLSGGIVRYAEDFVDPALSFANGWNLVYKELIFIPTEIVAAAVLMSFWVEVNNAVWITVFGLLMALTNCLFVRVFGELEFWFALLKIALIFIVNIMAIVIIAGGGPEGETLGFRYWKDPGPFVQYMGIQGNLGRFLGFYTTFTNALYAFSGIENISLAAAETQNARQVIPQAAKRVFWRILLFYSLTMFLVGLVVPSNDDRLLKSTGTAASPFVISATLAGIKVIPHVINAIVVTSAWSCGNYGMMSYVRYLFGLAKNGHAPKVFTRLNRFGILQKVYVNITDQASPFLDSWTSTFRGCKVFTLSRSPPLCTDRKNGQLFYDPMKRLQMARFKSGQHAQKHKHSRLDTISFRLQVLYQALQVILDIQTITTLTPPVEPQLNGTPLRSKEYFDKRSAQEMDQHLKSPELTLQETLA
ncbi:hypothetical protein ACKLNR_002907 [Fusarium oxysporum f. sp. zingiberi]